MESFSRALCEVVLYVAILLKNEELENYLDQLIPIYPIFSINYFDLNRTAATVNS